LGRDWDRKRPGDAQTKWGPASLPAPTAPSEGSAETHCQVPGEPDRELRLTSSGVASHQQLPLKEELDRSSELRRPKARISFEQVLPGPKAKADRCSAALLGMISTASRFASTGPKAGFSRVARSEDHLFRRLVPAGPETPPREHFTACRGDRTFGHLPHRLAVAGCLVRPGPPSRSPEHHAHLFRVAKAKNVGASLWITGISGKRRGTFFAFVQALFVGCRSVPPSLPRSSA
jgi:hypothetical protein